LIAANRAGTYAKLTIAGALTNFILNALLIPRWGANGAVISTLISYLPIEVIGLTAVSREIGGVLRRGDLSRAGRILIVSVLIWAVYSGFVPEPTGLPVTFVHAVLLTAALLISLLTVKAIEKDKLLALAEPMLRIVKIRSK
jgi:O-antigen/teichoic acid export membrane protein